MGPLINFLAAVRKAVCQHPKPSSLNLTLVLGNPSCDLDSFISAVVFSYFYSEKAKKQIQGNDHIYVPVLNLPTVPSSELWRLRPEFGTALRLATTSVSSEKPSTKDDENDATKGLLGNLITISDLTSASSSPLYSTFARTESGETTDGAGTTPKQDVVLVDHNAPSIADHTSQELSSRFNLTGCIDHHVDESTIPQSASPRIINQGTGSCTSLVVTHLRDESLWPQSSSTEIARLALAPILIDTLNLRATGDKCSATDRNAVAFLESQLDSATWDRDAFFNAISDSKANSLDLLTMPEIFARDYKEWSETSASTGQQLTVGIPSLVRSLTWLIQKAGSPRDFVNAVQHFAQETDHKLDIIAMLTKSSGPDGEFRKELVAVAFSGAAAKVLEKFQDKMKDTLQLGEWHEDSELVQAMEDKFTRGGGFILHWQGDTEKSRKQVAPALREAAKA